MRLHTGLARIATPALLGLALLLQFAHSGHDHDTVESDPPCVCVHVDRLEADVDSLQPSDTTPASRVVAGVGGDMRPVPGRLYGPGARAPPTA